MSLSCPTGGNLAAIAKQLHETALDAEARIIALEQTLRGAVNLPTLVQTTTAPQTGLVTGSDNTLGTSLSTTFANFDVTTGTQVVNDPTPFQLLGEAIYEVGFCGTIVPSGVANLNTFRVIRINHTRPNPALFPNPTVDFSEYTMYEPATGNGIDISMTGFFRVRPLDSLSVTLSHGNTSSTLTLNTGAIFWMHRISDVTVTAVL